MIGKEKCQVLKQIRKQIADNNEIPWEISECSHKGNCKGTCPKCESEVQYLEKELKKRQKTGKAVAVAGVSAAFLASFSACSPVVAAEDGCEVQKPEMEMEELAGEVYVPDELSGYVEGPEATNNMQELQAHTGQDVIMVLEYLDGEVAYYQETPSGVGDDTILFA